MSSWLNFWGSSTTQQEAEPKPELSPWLGPFRALDFGANRVWISDGILKQHPQFYQRHQGKDVIKMSGVPYHAAHVIVGFLNTHKYDGLQAKGATETDRNISDFGIAVRVYDVASKNGLMELQALAVKEFGTIGKELDFPTIIKTLSSNDCAGISITGTLHEYLCYRAEKAGQTMSEQDAAQLKELTGGTIAGVFFQRVANLETQNQKLRVALNRRG